VRRQKAKELGCRVGFLDSQVKAVREGNAGVKTPFPEVKPWPNPIDPAQLLHDISAAVRRFIVCGPEIADAVALWIAFTWFVDVVNIAPIAIISSPEPRCGKSQLLSIIGMLSARSLTASNISSSAIFRSIEAWHPSLMIDEADAFMRDNEELRGILNSGHTRDQAFVIRTVGDNFTPTRFSTWGPKALAGIGKLADTLMDRSIVLELRRKLPNEKVDRIRYAEPKLFDDLRSKLARFAEDYTDQVKQARPPLPVCLNDRAQDNWEPLLSIAMVAGGEWLEIGTQAALRLSGGESASQSIGIVLLADIREIFETQEIDRISTVDLINALCEDDEKPWKTYHRGLQITPRQVADS